MENELIITRMFNAPIDMVWDAWTSTELISEWWGPKGYHTVVKENDFRPGGRWEFVMVDGQGNEYPAIGVYKEIVKHKKISSTDEFGEDFKAKTEIDLPKILLFTGLFEEVGDQTKITLIYEHATEADKLKHLNMGMEQGWNSSLDKLVEFLEKK